MNFTYNNKNYPIIINYKNNKNLYIKVDDDFNIRINNQSGASIRLYSILEIISEDQVINIV